MPNNQLTPSSETDEFLEYLLRCALTAPGAATSPTAGRILARLLVVGAVEGGDELITPYLVPAPGGDATFEVRNYQPGNLTPTDIRHGMGAAAALKVALRNARESDDGIEVVSRSQSGLERCVLVRDSTGDFEFRFASHETMVGDPEECSAARQAWEATLLDWQTGIAPAPRVERRPPSDLIDAEVSPTAFDAPTRWWLPDDDELLLDAAAKAGDPVTPNVEGKMSGPIATAPGNQLGTTIDELRPDGDAQSAERATAGDDGAGPATGAEMVSDALTTAMREAIADLVVEVDFGQVEQVIRKVLEEDHRDMVDPLARRLAARMGENLVHPDTAAVIDIVSQLIPRPGDLAEAVAADVGALLSETVLRRRPGGGIGMGYDASNVMVGIEEVQVRLDGLNDQLQKAAHLLQAVTDHLEAGDRRSAAVERVALSVDQEMQRLAARIDEQVSALTAAASGGSELSDGVARLTRKLRQSVAQFDRVLLRMDEIADPGQLPAGGGSEQDPASRRRRRGPEPTGA